MCFLFVFLFLVCLVFLIDGLVCFVYPHALKASQSPQRSQRSQRPHRFERLNLAAAKKRGHIIHQRDLNTTRTQITTRMSFFDLKIVCLFCFCFLFCFFQIALFQMGDL